jgi:hypothetical protein
MGQCSDLAKAAAFSVEYRLKHTSRSVESKVRQGVRAALHLGLVRAVCRRR